MASVLSNFFNFFVNLAKSFSKWLEVGYQHSDKKLAGCGIMAT